MSRVMTLRLLVQHNNIARTGQGYLEKAHDEDIRNTAIYNRAQVIRKGGI